MGSKFNSSEWHDFATFVESASDVYENYTNRSKLQNEALKLQDHCPRSFIESNKTLTLDELQSLAPFIDWIKFINNQLPNTTNRVNKLVITVTSNGF